MMSEYITSMVTFDDLNGFDTDGHREVESETAKGAARERAELHWEQLEEQGEGGLRRPLIVLVHGPPRGVCVYRITWDYPMFSDRDPAQGDRETALAKAWPF